MAAPIISIESYVKRYNSNTLHFFKFIQLIHQEVKLTHRIWELSIYIVVWLVTDLSIKEDHFDKFFSDWI